MGAIIAAAFKKFGGWLLNFLLGWLLEWATQKIIAWKKAKERKKQNEEAQKEYRKVIDNPNSTTEEKKNAEDDFLNS